MEEMPREALRAASTSNGELMPSHPYGLPPDTKIATTHGMRPIAEFDPWTEEAVSRQKSALCAQQRVVAKYRYRFSGNLLRIKTEHGEILVTPEHGLFRRGTGYSGEPIQGFGGVWIQGRPHARIDAVSAGGLAVGNHVMMARELPAPAGGGRHGDPRLARFLGYFLGDGSYSTRTRYVRLADQSCARLGRYRDLLEDVLGPSVKSSTGAMGHLYRHGTKDCWYLQLASERLRAIIDLGRPKVELAQTLADADDHCVEALVSGFLEAEAHYRYEASGRLVAVTVVQSCGELLEALHFYLRRLGIVGQIRPTTRENLRLTVTDNLSLHRMLDLPVDKARADASFARPQFPGRAKAGYFWSRVAGIDMKQHDGAVYELEMAGERNFIADYFVVHNSMSRVYRPTRADANTASVATNP